MTPPTHEGTEINEASASMILQQEAFKNLTEKDLTILLNEKKQAANKESSESPIKKLEKERKAAAIAELKRLNMWTEEDEEKIKAIKFLDDKILIGNTPWSYKNMEGGEGTFKKETNQRYYDFAEREAEAKKQGLVVPEAKDFINTLKALPGEYSEGNWYQGGHILSIILRGAETGLSDSDKGLGTNSGYAYLGWFTKGNQSKSWNFEVNGSRGRMDWSDKSDRFVCRPLVKNS